MNLLIASAAPCRIKSSRPSSSTMFCSSALISGMVTLSCRSKMAVTTSAMTCVHSCAPAGVCLVACILSMSALAFFSFIEFGPSKLRFGGSIGPAPGSSRVQDRKVARFAVLEGAAKPQDAELLGMKQC